MNEQQLRHYTLLPDNVYPCKHVMVRYVLEFRKDTGTHLSVYDFTGQLISKIDTNKLINVFAECREYFQEKFKHHK